PAEGAQVLRGVAAAERFADVAVDHLGGHVPDPARAIDVAEEAAAGQLEQLGHDPGQRRVGHDSPLVDTALPRVREDEVVAANLEVALAQRADAEGAVP